MWAWRQQQCGWTKDKHQLGLVRTHAPRQQRHLWALAPTAGGEVTEAGCPRAWGRVDNNATRVVLLELDTNMWLCLRLGMGLPRPPQPHLPIRPPLQPQPPPRWNKTSIIIPRQWGGIVGGVGGEEALVKFQCSPHLVAENKGDNDNRGSVDVEG